MIRGLILIFLSFSALPTSDAVCQTQTSKGWIGGRLIQNTCVYQGIPYAQPPTGDLRFQPPTPATPWTGVRSTIAYSAWCPQSFPQASPINEDCLYLNVFQPMNVGAGAPVFLWIHGGGYVTGSGNRFPVNSVIQQMTQNGVVVVTMNYRLNAFGFMTTHTSELTPNLGMLDQVAGLKWVQQEITNFGGNPGRVTVGGESAGGASVSLLTYSPLSQSLFIRAIMQSGTALSPWAVDGRSFYSNSSRDLAVASGCITLSNWNAGSFQGLASCLRQLSWNSLLTLANQYETWNPVVDGPGGFLPAMPEQLSRPSSLTVMLGTNHDEWGWGSKTIDEITQSYFTQDIATVVTPLLFPQSYLGVRDLVQYAYVQSYPVDYNNHSTWLEADIQAQSEYMMHACTVKEVIALLNNNQTTFLYSFDFASDSLWGSSPYRGVTHFMDMLYLFPGLNDSLSWQFNQADYVVSAYFGKMWSNFITSGDPNIPNSPGNFHWQSVTSPSQRNYLSITPTPSMQSNYHIRADAFWNNLVPSLTPYMRDSPLYPTTTPGPMPSSSPAPSSQRTVIFLYKATTLGQDVFIRGGLDSNLISGCTQGFSPQDRCAVPIKHETKVPATDQGYIQWSKGDNYLDWHGAEPTQGTYAGEPAIGTPLAWSTNDSTNIGYQPLNQYGVNYWMVDLQMDCSRTMNGWFDFKGVMVDLGWEPNIQQAPCSGNGATTTPYVSINHRARCGFVNVFKWQDNSCYITSF